IGIHFIDGDHEVGVAVKAQLNLIRVRLVRNEIGRAGLTSCLDMRPNEVQRRNLKQEWWMKQGVLLPDFVDNLTCSHEQCLLLELVKDDQIVLVWLTRRRNANDQMWQFDPLMGVPGTDARPDLTVL